MRALRRPLTGPTAPRRAGRVWFLDLDDTLHDAQPTIMPRIDAAMTDYVAQHLGLAREEASALRLGYWKRYGATLLGLVTHHPIDPHHYLRETHRFPDMHRLVRRRPTLARALRQLPGRRIIVTNGPWHYARAVVRAARPGAHFHALFALPARSKMLLEWFKACQCRPRAPAAG